MSHPPYAGDVSATVHSLLLKDFAGGCEHEIVMFDEKLVDSSFAAAVNCFFHPFVFFLPSFVQRF